jgi:pimeloyl-ACP methyl ester carboxylesterase
MRPEGLQGLCLFHSTAAPDSPEKQEQRLKAAAFVREHGAAAFAKPLLQGLFAPSRAAEHAEALAQLQAKAALLEPEAIAQALLAMRGRPDARPWLREAALPIAFAAGGQDPVLPIGPLREQAALPREVRWHEWPEAGHMGMIECPEEAADLLEALVA